MKTDSSCRVPKAMALALARWCLGLILLIGGIAKFPMGIGNFAHYITGTFEKTWLPKFLVMPYGYALPFVELLLGALLLLGLFRNASLFLSGLLLLSLTFGQMLLAMGGDKDSGPVMFQNAVFTFLAAGVLFLAEHDRWVIRACCRNGESCGCAEGEPKSNS